MSEHPKRPADRLTPKGDAYKAEQKSAAEKLGRLLKVRPGQILIQTKKGLSRDDLHRIAVAEKRAKARAAARERMMKRIEAAIERDQQARERRAARAEKRREG